MYKTYHSERRDYMKQYELDKKEIKLIIGKMLKQEDIYVRKLQIEFNTYVEGMDRMCPITYTEAIANVFQVVNDRKKEYSMVLNAAKIKKHIIDYFAEREPDYKITNIDFDSGIKKDEKVAYFRGVMVTMVEKAKDNFKEENVR